MSVVFRRDEFQVAIVEHLTSSRHIYIPVDHLPEADSQYRIVCLAARVEDAWKVAHLLAAVSSGSHTYTVCPACAVGGDDRDESDAGGRTTTL
jgi:hypothetical protein